MKNIVLFSDATGYGSRNINKTNVWRLFQAIDQTKANQLAMYDDGIGMSSNKYLAAISSAFGFGLKRNVINLYKFVCRNYEKGDHIYGFGFSRGAFTIRILVDLIATEGLIPFRSGEELHRYAAAAYRQYRSKKFTTWSPIIFVMRGLRDALLAIRDGIKGYEPYCKIAEQTKAMGRAAIPIQFLGLWDTVEAYGMPIKELKRGIDWVICPMLSDDFILSPLVQRACHALSLDDERATFHPILWDEVAEARMVANHQVSANRLTQVWFAGAHSNVGGGYPEDQLSLVSLDWIMAQARDNGLILNEKAIAQIRAMKSPYARLYDSRAGFAAYYRYSPRRISIKQDQERAPIIHGSTVMRMVYGSDSYAPISLPREFWVLAPDGELLPIESTPSSLKIDVNKRLAADTPPPTKMKGSTTAEKALLTAAIEQLARPNWQAIGLVWDTVFLRRCLYFCTVGLTVGLALYPWFCDFFAQTVHNLVANIPFVGSYLATKWESQSYGPITSIINMFSAILPSYITPWKEALESHPLEFGIMALAIMVSLSMEAALQVQIRARARLVWHKSLQPEYVQQYKEEPKGKYNIALFMLAIAIAFLAFTGICGASFSIKTEFSILIAMLFLLLGIHSLAQRPISQSKTKTIQSTFMLSVARLLRCNWLLQSIYKWSFQRIVPILFALLFLIVIWSIGNRFLFDTVSAGGQFCKGSPPSDIIKVSKRTTSNGLFHTDQICWASGLLLKKGRHYRITLTTPGDWFEGSTHTDIAGFPAYRYSHLLATPLKRWWRENWFKPIARIGAVGNDEYVLNSKDEFETYSHFSCPVCTKQIRQCNMHNKISSDLAAKCMALYPISDNRKVVVSEIKARTTGELFLYVNDAVLMLPKTTLFFSNNRGTAKVTVEPMFAPPQH